VWDVREQAKAKVEDSLGLGMRQEVVDYL